MAWPEGRSDACHLARHGCYAEYRDEIDERIALDRAEAERQRQAWERMRDALG
jgi:hypothetical protein